MPTPNIGVMQGLANTGIDNSSTFVRDVLPKLFYLESFKYPLVSYLFTMGTELEKEGDKYLVKGSNAFKRKATGNPEFEQTESERGKFEFTPTAAVTTGASSVSVSTDDDDYFVAGDEILLVNAAGSREVARVTSVGSGSLNITRNVGSTGAIALTTADKFYKMGVVREEDSTSTSPRQTKSATLTNYVQFLTESYGTTKIEQATSNYHGSPYERKKMEALDRMKRNLEVMAWFGVKEKSSSTTNPVYHNGGVLFWLEQQYTDVPIIDANGIITKSTWDAYLSEALKYNSMNKVVFCSSAVLRAVNSFATNNIRVVDQSIQKYGMQIQEYISPDGVVRLVREPLFDEVRSTQGTAVTLDMNNILWRFLSANGQNLDLRAYDDIQENDRSGRKGEWSVVGGFQTTVGKSHAILKNGV